MQFLVFKSKSNLDYNTMIFDVGHGDSVLLLDQENKGLLLDCGSLKPQLHIEVPMTIESVLPKDKSCGFVVSHYHFDHYSLFHWIKNPTLVFSKIYVPYLPFSGPGFEAARAIMDFTWAAVLADYSYYRILPEIFGKTNSQIVPCKKGDFVTEGNQNLRILWPDISHSILGSNKIRQIARKVTATIESTMADLDYRVPTFQPEDSFSQFIEYVNYLKNQDLADEKKRKIQAVLGNVEGEFRTVANLLSIVAVSFRKRNGRILHLGDAEDDVLNEITISGSYNYSFIKAAHHGTCFGESISNLDTEFLIISRSKREFSDIKEIHDGYLADIQCRMILSTEHLHHCLVCA